MFKNLLASFTLIIISSFAYAQGDEVSLQFVSFPVSNTSAPVELLMGDGKSMVIELPTTCLSPVYKVPSMAQWSLGKTIIGAEDEQTFKSYGAAKSSGGKTQLILVIRKGASYEDGFEMIALKYGKTDFGGGNYFMMNATSVDIGVDLGSTKVGLKPNKYELVKPKASKVVNGRKLLFTKMFFRHKKKMKPFYSSTWRLNDKAKTLVFIYHEPRSKRIKTHTIRTYIR